MLYGTITEFCTEQSCPVMSAGPKYEYHWADGNQVKKPIKCSAPKYIDFLMTWVQDQLDDESLFPSKIGVPFPNNFLTNAKTILKRLFRVYAHVYHQHFKVEFHGLYDDKQCGITFVASEDDNGLWECEI